MLSRFSKFKEKVTEVVLALVAFGAFLYYVENNRQLYYESFTVSTGSVGPKAYTPPITICSDLPLNPVALLEFGLDIKTGCFHTALKDYLHLKGVEEGTPLLQLLNRTRFPLGHFVKEINLGHLREVYAINAKSSLLWESPAENILCYSLKPLPVTSSNTLIIHFRNKSEILSFYNSLREEYSDFSNNSQRALNILKRSGRFQYYISSKAEFSIENSVTPFEPLSDQMHLKVQSYSVRFVKVNEGHLLQKCHSRCYTEAAREEQLCFETFPGPNDKLKKPCSLNSHFISAETCLKKCGFTEFQENWCTMDEMSVSEKGVLRIDVKNRHKVFSEKYFYPAFKFYSDIGGCLGLFLGASLLSCFSWVQAAFEAIFPKIQKTWSDLTAYSVYLFLLVLLVTHLLISVDFMVENAGQIFVTLGLDKSIHVPSSNETQIIPSSPRPSGGHAHHGHGLHPHGGGGSSPQDMVKMVVDDALVKRWATRTFGCRVPSPVDPFIQCLMKDQGSGVFGASPFVDISDLPICQKSLMGFPVMRFAVPSYVLALLGDGENLNKCLTSKRSLSNEMNESSSNYKYKVEFSCGTNFSGAFVEFGGIFGLYFGLSLSYFLQKLLFHRVFMTGLKKTAMKVAEKTVMAILGIVTLMICGYQLYVFLYCHQVTQSTQAYPLKGKHPVAATVCHWPPINTQRLLEEVGLSQNPISPNIGSKLSDLAERFSMNPLLFHRAWNNSLLTLNETQDWVKVTDENINGSWDTTSLLGHRCYRFTLESYNSVYYFNKSESSDRLHLISFHSTNDKPLLEFLYNPKSIFHAVISKLSEYLTLEGSSVEEQYGVCFDKCIQEHLSKEFQCDMPFLENSYIGVNCNHSLILELLKWAFQPKPAHHNLYPFKSYSKAFDEKCKATCRRHSRTFLEMHRHSVHETFTDMVFTVVLNDTIRVSLSPDLHSKEVTTEYDGYAFSQMVSQMGGAIGIVLGASLLSALRMVFGFE